MKWDSARVLIRVIQGYSGVPFRKTFRKWVIVMLSSKSTQPPILNDRGEEHHVCSAHSCIVMLNDCLSELLRALDELLWYAHRSWGICVVRHVRVGYMKWLPLRLILRAKIFAIAHFFFCVWGIGEGATQLHTGRDVRFVKLPASRWHLVNSACLWDSYLCCWTHYLIPVCEYIRFRYKELDVFNEKKFLISSFFAVFSKYVPRWRMGNKISIDCSKIPNCFCCLQ